MSDARAPVAILTSGVGLGLYIPALLVHRRLRRLGLAADVEVIEGWFAPAFQRGHLAHRDAHHASFALAQLAHRMARGVGHCLDAPGVDALLARWADEGRRRFVLWAGFWLPVLERYRALVGGAPLEVDHCRIDATVSASFRVHPELDARGCEVWLWHEARGALVHELPCGDAPPVPFAARDDRLVVHGGGWGIGTYSATLPELAATRWAIDAVVHADGERGGGRAGDREFMLDPAWRTWDGVATGEPAFPPMRALRHGEVVGALPDGEAHAMHAVIRGAKAIVSKPGGCTLIDSLAAATPVVLLEPYGDAEAANGRLWTRLGFGIGWDAWRATGFDEAVLARLHANIVARTRGATYPDALLAHVARERA